MRSLTNLHHKHYQATAELNSSTSDLIRVKSSSGMQRWLHLCLTSALISSLILYTSVTSFTLPTKRTQPSTIRRSNDLRPDTKFNRLISQISAVNADKDGIEVEPQPRTVTDTTIISVIATAIALTAFSFQVFGIFPWHAKLQAGFESVKVHMPCLLLLLT